MRVLFTGLLLTNLLVLAYILYLDRRPTIETDIVLLQINPDKIRLLKRDPRSESRRDARATMSGPAETTPVSCMQWGTFSIRESGDAAAALERLNLGSSVSRRETADDYWVFIPPLRSQAEAVVEAARLKRIGISDLYIMREGKWNLAISLGVFRKRDQAEQRLTELKAQGVVSAVLAPRGATRIAFVIRLPNEAVAAALADLRSQFAGSQLVSVACG